MVMQSYAHANPCQRTKTEDCSSRFARVTIAAGVSDRKT
jgi:hypothetical protein